MSKRPRSEQGRAFYDWLFSSDDEKEDTYAVKTTQFYETQGSAIEEDGEEPQEQQKKSSGLSGLHKPRQENSAEWEAYARARHEQLLVNSAAQANYTTLLVLK